MVYSPSKLSVAKSGIAELVVRCPDANPNPVPEENLNELDKEFASLNPEEVTAERLQKLAADHDFLTGKWIAFATKVDVDRLWRKLVKALMEGEFSEQALAIKVGHYILMSVHSEECSLKIL